ncbi:MAG: polysaccharide deacetylase family protein [Lachnospiraceae bacterium]|uniref:Polysaccharide deacetylase family protein n=1 Tax=Hominifimenecus microfluidus TaxID=2885348 RepID=A0AAE3E9X2_9FIRM|nr:polysaccharide deacetylase family protein [Hominifimenecus microfluidus]MCC2230712.1 polysaccharide deacetylase family protein [Hominifimenecus microfluidus]
MWKQKMLVVGLCLMLFLAGFWKNGEAWEADADVDADIGEEKRIAITFDDGPHRLYTPKLLDGLKERGIHATFFLVGENIGNNEALVKRMAEEGHLIGNHTFSHVQLTKMKKEDACREVQQTNERICAVTGAPVLYIRPPYGSWNDELQAEIPMTVTLWNLDSEDWKSQNTGKIVELVESEAKEGSIILLHDIFDTSVEAALRIVDDLTAQGYTFVTVDELLLD